MKRFSTPDWLFFALLVFFSLVFLRLISYFILDIFLAIIFTQLFHGILHILCTRFKINRSLASLICVLLILIMIILPIVVVGTLLYSEVANLYCLIKNHWPQIQVSLSRDHIEMIQKHYPLFGIFGDIAKMTDLQTQVGQMMSSVTGGLVKFLQQTMKDLSLILLHLLITLILAFFLLQDGTRFLKHILYLSPLRDKDEQELIEEVRRMTYAALAGTVIIGLVDGAFGGILFAILGIPSPLLWAGLMMLASIIPLLGIHIILFPTGLFLLFTGHIWSGFILLTLSHLGTSFTQHYLKPLLIGKQGGVHPGIILVSTLGGIAWFGPIGFLVGPIIASLFLSIWDQFGRHYKEELDGWNSGKRMNPLDS